jgi:hypothetical protein
MRPSVLLVLGALAVACPGFNKTSLRHWYPPPDSDLLQECTGERASRCTDKALALIAPGVADPSPQKAAVLLGAACQQGDGKACDTLDARFVGPKLLTKLPDGIGHGLPHASASYGEIACTITVEGEATRCRSIRNGGYNSDYIDALLRQRFSPATFDGRPFESEYVQRYTIEGDYT